MKFKELLKVIKQDETLVICYKDDCTYAKQSDLFNEDLLESEIKHILPDYDTNLIIVMENYKE